MCWCVRTIERNPRTLFRGQCEDLPTWPTSSLLPSMSLCGSRTKIIHGTGRARTPRKITMVCTDVGRRRRRRINNAIGLLESIASIENYVCGLDDKSSQNRWNHTNNTTAYRQITFDIYLRHIYRVQKIKKIQI